MGIFLESRARPNMTFEIYFVITCIGLVDLLDSGGLLRMTGNNDYSYKQREVFWHRLVISKLF